MTRTVFFGNASVKQKEIYSTVLTAQDQAVQYISTRLSQRLPIKAHIPDNISRSYIIQKGYPTIPHSLGHGIGLQVHEAPRLTPVSQEDLTEGNVFSIEPGVYLPGVCGVRIEDLYAITNGTLTRLTHADSALLELT